MTGTDEKAELLLRVERLERTVAEQATKLEKHSFKIQVLKAMNDLLAEIVRDLLVESIKADQSAVKTDAEQIRAAALV